MEQNDNWQNHFPSELLCKVFKLLDGDSILSCMEVCQRWSDNAHYVAQNCGGWDRVLREKIPNEGVTYKMKSKLSLEELYQNSLQWNQVNKAPMSLLHEYNTLHMSIKNMKIYKDNLILVGDRVVHYFDIETSRLKKTINVDCYNFEESDYMFVISKHFDTHCWYEDRQYLLQICKKNHPDDTFIINEQNKHFLKQYVVLKHFFDNDKCYTIEWDCIVVSISWVATSEQLVEKPVGRLYETDRRLKAMHVCREDHGLFITMESGKVYRCDTRIMETLLLMTIERLGDEMTHDFKIFTFHSMIAAVQVRSTSQMNLVRTNENKQTVLYAPKLSCVMDHGNVLFFGYDDGKIDIVLSEEFNKDGYKPAKSFNVCQFDGYLFDPQILWLDVYEGRDKHVLFVKTKEVLVQLLVGFILK